MTCKPIDKKGKKPTIVLVRECLALKAFASAFTKITLTLHLNKNTIYLLNELTNLEKDIEKIALKKKIFK